MSSIRIRPPSKERLLAIARQRCPNCLEGKVFDGMIRMRERCSVCGHVFLREQGYFQGAMYVSYGLGLVALFIMVGVLMLVLPSHSEYLALVISIPIFFALVPMLYRYSRILWMHIFFRAF